MLDFRNAEIFRVALESLHTGVCLVDQQRTIGFWNEGAEKITGYLRQDVIGRVSTEVLTVTCQDERESSDAGTRPLLAALRDGKPCESNGYVNHKRGYPVPVTIRAVPIRDEHNRIIGAVESFAERLSLDGRRLPELQRAENGSLDRVTQLPDCTFMENYLAERVRFADQHDLPLGLLCIQVDQLDKLKGTHGRDAVEAVLNVIAQTLRNGLDPMDFVGLWSEDQFLALTANYLEADLLSTAERLRRLTQSSEVVWWGDPLTVTVSVGCASLGPQESLLSLLSRTGLALNQSVAMDGNSVSIAPTFEPPADKEN